MKIVRTSVDGRETVVAVRGPGELVGELNALAGSPAPRAGSVVAMDDVIVQAIAAADLMRFLERHPAASVALLRVLATRFREATARQADAAGYDIVHRVARALLAQAEHGGRADDGDTGGRRGSQPERARRARRGFAEVRRSSAGHAA